MSAIVLRRTYAAHRPLPGEDMTEAQKMRNAKRITAENSMFGKLLTESINKNNGLKKPTLKVDSRACDWCFGSGETDPGMMCAVCRGSGLK